MDITSVASFATTSTQQRAAQAIKIEVYKQALDIAKTSIGTLIESIQPAPQLPAHLGQNINTTA